MDWCVFKDGDKNVHFLSIISYQQSVCRCQIMSVRFTLSGWHLLRLCDVPDTRVA